MAAIEQSHHTTLALRALMSRIRACMQARGAHAARTVVLMPFAHLAPLARTAWAAVCGDGFTPRFETTQLGALASDIAPGPNDFTGNVACDLLTAQSLLQTAGLGARADVLAPRLVAAAAQLAPVAAAVAPARRAAWAGQARASLGSGADAGVLALEAATARIALEWAAMSAYATDTLFDPRWAADVDLLVIVRGSRDDPLAESLRAALGDRAEALTLDADAPRGSLQLHEAQDPADEAERAAACVLRHLAAGRVPVAVPALDRVLTRRIRAMVAAHAGVSDETGWKLSTTRAGAHVMLALRASNFAAGADAVIDWLKNAPQAASADVLALERRMRRSGAREWRSLRADDSAGGQKSLLEWVNALREKLQAPRGLTQWLTDLREVLEATGQWSVLEQDAAGGEMIDALGLGESAASWRWLPQAARRMGLADFTAWAGEILEARSFKQSCPDPQVVILPLHQMLGRPFAALVLAGCDEVRLASSPQPEGAWTVSQRQALGLPLRGELESQMRAAWQQALQTPHCDLLWRLQDDSGEAVLPSPLVQALQMELATELAYATADDPRERIDVAAAPTPRPAATGDSLPVKQLSASAYEDLRRCPYRFFAMRQLDLREADEIDADLDKRDFGNWLHQVLRAFHESLANSWVPAGAARRDLLDSTAQQVTRDQQLDAGEFLPFAAAWPQVREGYLTWLEGHEAKEGARFEQAESEQRMPFGGVTLIGRIDRIDAVRGGLRMVMDYKTEARGVTADRVRSPVEDTQLAFYAALLPDDSPRAAYINVGERGKTETLEQAQVVAARDLLVEGILDDMGRIGQGEAMLALGEGKACEFCAARGLCRKDFWS